MSKPRKLLENRDAWGVILGYLEKEKSWDYDQVADLKRECKEKRIPQELAYLDEALQQTFNPEGLKRAAVLTEAFNIPRPLNLNEGWKIYLECYETHKLSLQLFLAAFVMGGNKKIHRQINLLPVNILLDNIEEITAMLADDPRSQKFNIQLQLACIQKHVPDLAVELNKHGATPPDFKEVFDTVCDEKSGLTIHPSTAQVMNALIKDPINSFECWFLKNKVLAELYIIRVVLHLHETTMAALVDPENATARRHKEIYQTHLSLILRRSNYQEMALLIYNILLDPMIQAVQEDNAPSTSSQMFSPSSVFAPARAKLHDRFDQQHFIAACRVINFLITEHQFPALNLDNHVSRLFKKFEFEPIVYRYPQESKQVQTSATVKNLNAVLKIKHRKELAESSTEMLEAVLIRMFGMIQIPLVQEHNVLVQGISDISDRVSRITIEIISPSPYSGRSNSWETYKRIAALEALMDAIKGVEKRPVLDEEPIAQKGFIQLGI